MKFSRRSQIAAAAIAAAMALTGCSSGGETGSPDQDLALNLSIQSPPSNFSIGNWSGGDATLFLSVYDSLVSLDLEGQIVPSIATSWKYSDDGKTLTFALRAGMNFTDGTPVDAAAVAASLNAALKGASSSAQLGAVAEVEAPDDSTVVLTLSRPDASLLPSLAGVSGGVGATDDLTAESSKLEPVGSGAYLLDKAKTTVGSLYTLTRNPDNWNVDAYPYETVSIRVIQDSTAAQNALKTGQLDFAGITPDLVSQFPTNEFTSGTSLPTAVGALWLVDRAGTIVPALADLRVRQAINMAVDRETIATNLTPGSSTASNQVLSPSGLAFDDDALDTYSYDLDAARDLMADAGYADGFDVTMPSTPISTLYDSTVSQQLADIGIRVTYENVPFQDFYSKVFAGNYGMFFMYNGFSGSDAQDVNASLQGLFNPFNSTSEELQTLIDAANAAPADEQGAAFRAVNNFFIDEAWFSPVSYATGTWVASNDLTYTPPVVGSQNVLPFRPATSN